MTDPLSFKDFYNSEDNPDRKLPASLQSAAVATESIAKRLAGLVLGSGAELSSNSQMEFGERVAEITHSDNFIDELSREIGVPRADETEQGFVERAKEAMASLLRTKFG